MRTMRLWQAGKSSDTALPTSLLASAICNSARAPTRRRRRAVAWPIVERIRNCVMIASHLGPDVLNAPKETPFEYAWFQPRDFMQLFCTAASTSTYCQEYMYMHSSYVQYFATYAEGDIYLEVALLVACGFCPRQVVSTMVEFVKEGKLRPYVGGKVWGHTKSGRRWPSGVNEQHDPDRKWNCGRCGKSFGDTRGGSTQSVSTEEYILN